jgi:hypothetical protein
MAHVTRRPMRLPLPLPLTVGAAQAATHHLRALKRH